MIEPSRVVPTEYDVERTRLGVMLVDDHGRRFRGRTLRAALRRAERAQDPNDPIHEGAAMNNTKAGKE